MSAALITLREGLEAALIVAIVVMYLTRLGRRDRLRAVWTGVGAAVAASSVAGAFIGLGTAALPHRTQELIEGAAGLLAVGVLSWMVFWMRRQAASIRGNLEERVDAAMSSSSAIALPLL